MRRIFLRECRSKIRRIVGYVTDFWVIALAIWYRRKRQVIWKVIFAQFLTQSLLKSNLGYPKVCTCEISVSRYNGYYRRQLRQLKQDSTKEVQRNGIIKHSWLEREYGRKRVRSRRSTCRETRSVWGRWQIGEARQSPPAASYLGGLLLNIAAIKLFQ